MIPCARFAFYTLARDASFFGVAAVTLMLAFSFEPPLACKIGATVALLFAILLLVRNFFLTEERFLRSEAWRALKPEERPAGEDGPLLARALLQELLLRFAKGASGVGGLLYCSALVLSVATAQPDPDTFVTAGAARLR